jgi:Fe-S cluster assembly protein SufD
VVTELNVGALARESVEQLSAFKQEPAWMRDLRLEAFQLYEDIPMPVRTDEDWRRTDIRRLKLDAIGAYTGASAASAPSPLKLETDVAGGELLQDNGEPLSSSLATHLAAQGVIFTTLDAAVRDHADLVRRHFMTNAVPAATNKFTALNGAFWSGGVFLYVPTGIDVALPLHTLYSFSSPDAALFPHTVVVLEPGAKLTYIEEYVSAGLGDANAVSSGVVEATLGQEAKLTLVTLQEYVGRVFDLNTQRALLDRDSRLDWLVIGLGNGTTKSNIEVAMQGPGASTQMLGVLWGYEHQHTDYRTLQDHQAPNCTSDLLYKAALIDEATSVFSGRIRVEKAAHRTDSYQANRTVILSDKASAYPSPNLEIEANDVRCTHGASVGKVDADQLFYLMSRGLSKDIATKMIVEGFFEEVLQREPAAAIRDNLRELILRKMEGRT